MTYSRLESSLPRHPKTARLARALGSTRIEAMGWLAAWWCWLQETRPSGDLSGIEPAEIDLVLDWPGPGSLAEALITCGWIDRREDGSLEAHGWLERAESYRAAQSEARRRTRVAQEGTPVHPTVEPRVAHAPPTDAPQPPPRGERGERGAKGEEREDACTETREARSAPAVPDAHPAPVPQDEPEEVAEGSDATHDPPTHHGPRQAPLSTSEPPTLALPAEPEPGGEVVLRYPCAGLPRAWDLTRRQVAEWSRLYPRLDVEDECRRALAWITASPSRRKTARGMPRMLVSWLGRATDRPASAGAGPGGEGLPPPQVMSDRGRQQLANGLEWIRRAEEEDRRRAAEEDARAT